jgi:hypothetical protein
MRGRTKSKRLPHPVSLWTRSILKERRDFKAQARGSRLQAVAFGV